MVLCRADTRRENSVIAAVDNVLVCAMPAMRRMDAAGCLLTPILPKKICCAAESLCSP